MYLFIKMVIICLKILFIDARKHKVLTYLLIQIVYLFHAFIFISFYYFMTCDGFKFNLVYIFHNVKLKH